MTHCSIAFHADQVISVPLGAFAVREQRTLSERRGCRGMTAMPNARIMGQYVITVEGL
jgi:hypothetical protein